MTVAEREAARFAKQQAELEAGDAARQEKRAMLKTIDSAKLIRKQKDRRHRPRGVKKRPTKRARKLRLTSRLNRRRSHT